MQFTSKEYIKGKMQSLVKTFKSIKTSYSFHELSSTHSIEIIPNHIYYQQQGIFDWENNLILDFISLFPDESICVLTEDSIVPIANIEFAIAGRDFGLEIPFHVHSKCIYDVNLFDDHFYNTFEIIFETHVADLNREVYYSQSLVNLGSLPSLFDNQFNLKQLGRRNTEVFDNNVVAPTEIVKSENDTYSLAA